MSDHLHSFPWYAVLLIVVLVVLNGVLSMSEMAIVSSREARLKALARHGNRGAQTALDLASEPGRFLSTVQSGITAISVIAGAFSGATLGDPVAQRLELAGLSHETAHTLGVGLVVVLTTYLTLVIGEIVPKQIALRSPEPIAVIMSRPMLWLSRITAPFVWLLENTSALIFGLLGLDKESKNHVTAEELHLVVAEAQTAGVLEESERAIISGVVRLADRPVREVMTSANRSRLDRHRRQRGGNPRRLAGNAAQPGAGCGRIGREHPWRHPGARCDGGAALRPDRSTSASSAVTHR